MNYQHDYHAGNFADVVKHITLIALIKAFCKKPTPFCFIDTHAGAGYYDLNAKTTQKKKEYLDGIEKIIQASNPPELVKLYLDCIHLLNNKLSDSNDTSLDYYPGSPMIAERFLREHDRIIACELSTRVYQKLKDCFANSKKIATHHMDGYLGLKAFLPPKERRGFVLIDPPYEETGELARIAHTLPAILKRWETGCYVIWYPIKEKKQLKPFYHSLKQNISQSILITEFTIFPEIATHLNGCGLAVINPPWQLDKTLKAVLPWLWQTLNHSPNSEQSVYFL